MRIPFEEMGGQCVFTSEIDKFCQLTYQANFGQCTLGGDIKPYSENPEKIPAHDVLLAGFPCQPFSKAGIPKKNSIGQAHGFSCNLQGTLFFDIARILKHHRPAAFLLENVPNLLQHDKGRTFEIIMRVLEQDLGYYVTTQIINAFPWVPQNRKRLFLCGFSRFTPINWFDFETPMQSPKLRDILEPIVPSRYTLSKKTWEPLEAWRKSKNWEFDPYHIFSKNDVTTTLTAHYAGHNDLLLYQENKRPRRLTPRECARLMGFDKPNESKFKIPVSDFQAYKQFGNAVVVPVVRAIAHLMHPHIVSVKNARSPVP